VTRAHSYSPTRSGKEQDLGEVEVVHDGLKEHDAGGWHRSARVSDALALIDLDGTLVDRDRGFALWAGLSLLSATSATVR
jgi:hypothetical protein